MPQTVKRERLADVEVLERWATEHDAPDIEQSIAETKEMLGFRAQHGIDPMRSPRSRGNQLSIERVLASDVR